MSDKELAERVETANKAERGRGMKLADLMDVLVDTEYLLLDKTGAGIGKGRVTYEGKVEGCANLYPNSKVSKATAAYDGDCLYISIRV